MVNSCLSRLVRQQAEKYGDKVALKYRDYTTATWIPVTWNGFADLVDKTARAFVKLGVEVQENVGVFSQNKPECLYVDFGAFKDRICNCAFVCHKLRSAGTLYCRRCWNSFFVCRRAVSV